MNSSDTFSAYRRMIATHDDSVVNWWYSGWTFVQIEGRPRVPLMQIMAIMTYRTETLSEDSFRIHWSEIGVFKDPATGEIPDVWINPLTGARVQPPRTFQEGPGQTTITSTPNGLHFNIVQPHATLRDASVRFEAAHGRLSFTQREMKLRGFPTPDGSLPPPGSPAGFEGITELSFFASLDDLARPPDETLPVQGIYSFVLMGLSRAAALRVLRVTSDWTQLPGNAWPRCSLDVCSDRHNHHRMMACFAAPPATPLLDSVTVWLLRRSKCCLDATFEGLPRCLAYCTSRV